VGLVLSSVRSAGPHGHYYVEAEIDGIVRSSLVIVIDSRFDGIEPQDEDWETYFGQYAESRFLVGVVLRVHRGEQIDFPLDLRPQLLEWLKEERRAQAEDDE
jgi:hypothetical protein